MNEELIIIIDDDPGMLFTLKQSCKKKGFTALTFNNGADGLNALAKNDVAVIISDYRMPRMTGIDVLNKAQEISPDTVRVLLSGELDLELALDAVSRGAVFRIISKPCKDSDFESTLYQCLEKYNLLQDYHHIQRELLEQSKVDAARATVVTLHHEINNTLVTLGANISILNRSLNQNKIPNNHVQILDSMKQSYNRIKNCIVKLELVEDIEMIEYANGTMMLDADLTNGSQPSNDSPSSPEK